MHSLHGLPVPPRGIAGIRVCVCLSSSSIAVHLFWRKVHCSGVSSFIYAGQSVSSRDPLSLFPGGLCYRCSGTHLAFYFLWVLRIKTQVLKHAWQALYPLRHLPCPMCVCSDVKVIWMELGYRKTLLAPACLCLQHLRIPRALRK